MYIFSVQFQGSDPTPEVMVKSVHYSDGVISVIHMDDETQILNFAAVSAYTFRKATPDEFQDWVDCSDA